MCILIWLFEVEFTENADPQTSQENGFSPLCVHMCLFKWVVQENDDQQIKKYVFLVCPQVCFCNVEPHIPQENGFPPACSLFRVDLKENTVPQTSQ